MTCIIERLPQYNISFPDQYNFPNQTIELKTIRYPILGIQLTKKSQKIKENRALGKATCIISHSAKTPFIPAGENPNFPNRMKFKPTYPEPSAGLRLKATGRFELRINSDRFVCANLYSRATGRENSRKSLPRRGSFSPFSFDEGIRLVFEVLFGSVLCARCRRNVTNLFRRRYWARVRVYDVSQPSEFVEFGIRLSVL